MSEDTLVRELTDRLLPDEPPTFFDDFWSATAARERADARRWRRISLGAAAAAVAALGAAAVIAAPFGGTTVVDQRVSCRLQLQGGTTVLNLAVAPTRKKRALPIPHATSAQLFLVTGADWFVGTKLVSLDNAAKGYMINRSECGSGTAVPLAPRGLPRDSVLTKGVYTGLQYRCVGTGRVLVHVRLTQGSHGEPVRAQIAVASAKTHRQLLYSDWSPSRVTTYARPDCETSDF